LWCSESIIQHFLFYAPGSSVVRSINDLVDFEEDTFPSRSTPPSNTRALASTSKYHGNYLFFVLFRKQFFNLNCCFSATSNRPGSSVVRSINDLGDFEEDTFPSRSSPPSNTRALASTSKNHGNYLGLYSLTLLVI
jgi:hypothetical protein